MDKDFNIDKMFEDVRNIVLRQIFPDTWNVIDDEYHREVTYVDKYWNTKKNWYDNVRITNPMNSDTEGIRKIQETLRENDGRYVSVATPELINSLKC